VIYEYSSKASRLPQGSIQPDIQWVWGARSPGLQRPEHEVHRSPPSKAEVKVRGAISQFPMGLHNMQMDSFYKNAVNGLVKGSDASINET
jgi:hypothetical protein